MEALMKALMKALMEVLMKDEGTHEGTDGGWRVGAALLHRAAQQSNMTAQQSNMTAQQSKMAAQQSNTTAEAHRPPPSSSARARASAHLLAAGERHPERQQPDGHGRVVGRQPRRHECAPPALARGASIFRTLGCELHTPSRV
eukprot:2204957-Prymnesium_polylepis.1